jgi:cell division protein ZapA
MTNKPNAVAIHILDKEYLISCPPGEEDALRQSAKHVDERMREVKNTGKIVGTDRLAVMTALNIAHELINMQSKPANIDQESLNKLDEIQTKIEQKVTQYESQLELI